jgi:hypothetical protein
MVLQLLARLKTFRARRTSQTADLAALLLLQAAKAVVNESHRLNLVKYHG